MCLTPSPFPRPRQLDDRQPLREIGKALIYADEAQRIARFVREYPDTETGGDLFGYWTHSGAPVVSYAIGPGCGSRHYPTSFYQNADWLHDVGTRLYDQHGLQHVGEWHSHHLLGVNHPSHGDIRTVVRGMAAKGWRQFLLMIATLDPRPNSPVLQNYCLMHPDGRWRPLRVQTLAGASPFRSGPEDPREEPIAQPGADAHWRPGPMTPPAHSVAAAFPGAWFATNPGKTRLRRIAADLESKGAGLPLSSFQRPPRPAAAPARCDAVAGRELPRFAAAGALRPAAERPAVVAVHESGGLVSGGLAVAPSAPAHRAAPPDRRPIGGTESTHDRSRK